MYDSVSHRIPPTCSAVSNSRPVNYGCNATAMWVFRCGVNVTSWLDAVLRGTAAVRWKCFVQQSCLKVEEVASQADGAVFKSQPCCECFLFAPILSRCDERSRQPPQLRLASDMDSENRR